jgi:hypothetical protein
MTNTVKKQKLHKLHKLHNTKKTRKIKKSSSKYGLNKNEKEKHIKLFKKHNPNFPNCYYNEYMIIGEGKNNLDKYYTNYSSNQQIKAIIK